MESRNFVAAREMVAGGSWLIPTMNGALRLAKPPLPTWAVAGLQELVGPTDNLAVLRLPAACMATLLVFFFWGLMRELTRQRPSEIAQPGRTAWLGALVLASCLLIITVGRDGQWDIFSNAWMVGGLWLLLVGFRTGHLLAYVAAGTLIGCSILSKGPVALYTLLLPFVGSYFTRWSPRPPQLRKMGLGLIIVILIGGLVGGSWPWYVWQHVQPSVLAVARVEVASWGERHVQPLWYYLNFPVFTGVWAVVAVVALVIPYARSRASNFVPYVFGFVWLSATFVLLSIVPEKKERYMLPLLLPMVMLLVGVLRHWEKTPIKSAADKWIIRAWAVLVLLVALAVPIAFQLLHLPGFASAGWRFWVTVAGSLGLLIAVGNEGLRKLNTRALVTGSLALMTGILVLLMPAYPAWEARKSDPTIQRMTAIRTRWGNTKLPWYSSSELQIKQVWAAGRPIPRFRPDTTTWPQPALLLISSSANLPTTALGRSRLSFKPARVDSFYTGRDSQSEKLYVHLIKPK